jgi:hypothetical protein
MSVKKERKERKKYDYPDPARWEGSRFVVWQICRLAAGGSRDRSSVLPSTQRSDPTLIQGENHGLIPGAACCQHVELATYKAAPLPTRWIRIILFFVLFCAFS